MWRQNFPLLVAGLAIFILLSHTAKSFASNNIRVFQFYSIAGFILVFILHGFDFIWLYLIALVNYAIAKVFKGSKWNPTLCWIWNAGILFLCNYYPGFKSVFPYLGISLFVSTIYFFHFNNNLIIRQTITDYSVGTSISK
jgi:hypothetical protein